MARSRRYGICWHRTEVRRSYEARRSWLWAHGGWGLATAQGGETLGFLLVF
ncbi:hypothetical protein V6Z11_A01G102100 [Gossypium hirsutum]